MSFPSTPLLGSGVAAIKGCMWPWVDGYCWFGIGGGDDEYHNVEVKQVKLHGMNGFFNNLTWIHNIHVLVFTAG